MWTKMETQHANEQDSLPVLSLSLCISFFERLSLVLMRLSKQRRAIPTWGLENLRFAVIGLPTVKPISPEIEPGTMNLPKEWIGSLVCGRLRKSGRHQGWECRWNAGRGTREQRTFGWKQMRSGRLLFFHVRLQREWCWGDREHA